MSEHPSITCPKCNRTSYNPSDIAHGYCGWCHAWTGAPGDVAKIAVVEMATQCPACLATFVLCTSNQGLISDRKPRAGEISICTECGELLMFEDHTGTKLRPAELRDLVKLSPALHRELSRAQQWVRAGKPQP